MSKKNTYLYALGINNYDEFQDLKYCGNDAVAFGNVIAKHGAIITSDVICSSPTKAVRDDDVRQVLGGIQKLKLGHTDSIFFYFAGHGASAGGRDYLLCSNTPRSKIPSAVPMDDIIAALNQTDAGTTVLVVDACRNYIDRSASHFFGEASAELARRKGVVTFFGCSPGEVCQEAADLGPGHGVFTFAINQILDRGQRSTPTIIDEEVIQSVLQICEERKLSKQTPYTTISPLQKASIDLFTGKKIHHNGLGKRRCILLIGPSNAGKSSIGQRLASELGYTHVEMSSFAWRRFQAYPDYGNSMQDFMEEVVWRDREYDVIAKDLLEDSKDVQKLVICGPRRTEEIETLRSQDLDINAYFVYTNSKTRFGRHESSTGQSRYSLSYKDFVRKDMQEYSWGLAKASSMRNVELEINEGTLEEVITRIRRDVSS